MATYGATCWERESTETGITFADDGTIVIHENFAIRPTGPDPDPLAVINLFLPVINQIADVLILLLA